LPEYALRSSGDTPTSPALQSRSGVTAVIRIEVDQVKNLPGSKTPGIVFFRNVQTEEGGFEAGRRAVTFFAEADAGAFGKLVGSVVPVYSGSGHPVVVPTLNGRLS